jgi:hypothetical protein
VHVFFRATLRPLWFMMANLRTTRTFTRAPRIALRGAVPVAIQLENGRQLTVRLHQLSITGGLLELATYVDERSHIAMAFAFGSMNVHANAELLFPRRGGLSYMQPFRFTGFATGVRPTLELEITKMLRQMMAATQSSHRLPDRSPRFSWDS